MIALTGTAKQITWAEKIRADKIAIVTDHLAGRGPINEKARALIEFMGNGISDAGWWIDFRGQDVARNIATEILALMKKEVNQ